MRNSASARRALGSPVNLDHVSLRRFLLDEHYVQRDSAGQSYRLTATDWPYTFDPSIKTLDLEALIDEARAARELKKQQYMSKSAGWQPGSSFPNLIQDRPSRRRGEAVG